MTQQDLLQIALLVGGTLCGAGALVGLLIWMAVGIERQAKKRTDEIEVAWRQVAGSLGLTLGQQFRRKPQLDGSYRDRKIAVAGAYGGSDSNGSTRVSMDLGLQTDVYFVARSSRMLGVETIASGDPELDRRYKFTTRPPGFQPRLLANPAVRQMLLQGGFTEVKLTPAAVAVIVVDVEKDPQRLRLMIELAGELAETVEREIGVTLPERLPPPQATYDAIGVTTIRLNRRLVISLAAGLIALCVCGVAAWMLYILIPIVRAQ